MSHRVAFVWHDDLRHYDFGPGHPLAPVRVQLAYRLSRDFGLLDDANLTMVTPATMPDGLLASLHSADFIEAVQQETEGSHGLGTDDVPTFPDMHKYSELVCAATLAVTQAVYRGEADHGVNFAGGLHHAMPDRASGFCVYNDVATSIKWLLDQGVERVAYVDVDVHHGDGVQQHFWDDPRVLTISLHESPRTLFPGTGWPTEIGGPGAEGSAINVALPPGTADNAWLRAFDAIVPAALKAFDPQYLVTQQGCDSHFQDPLAHMSLSIEGQRMSYRALHRLAHTHTEGRWIATGGGGYEWVDVVPLAWTHLLAEALERPIEPTEATPEAFRELVSNVLQRDPPLTMGNDRDPWVRSWEMGYNPDDPVDAAVLASRRAAFPHLGIDPDPDPMF
jgi:acetoin utilization protein AcuC